MSELDYIDYILKPISERMQYIIDPEAGAPYVKTELQRFCKEDLPMIILDDIKTNRDSEIKDVKDIVNIYSFVDWYIVNRVCANFEGNKSVIFEPAIRILNKDVFKMCCIFTKFHAFCMILISIQEEFFINNSFAAYRAHECNSFVYKDPNGRAMINLIHETYDNLKGYKQFLEDFLLEYYKINMSSIVLIQERINWARINSEVISEACSLCRAKRSCKKRNKKHKKKQNDKMPSGFVEEYY